MTPVNIAVIGCGYWGPNLIRNFAATDKFAVAAVADLSEERLAWIKRQYPYLHTTTSYQELLDDPEIDAVAIATPLSTHYPLAKAALVNGKHVLVEKPMTATVDEAQELIELAEENGRILMIDHTFIYTGAVRKMRELMEAGEIGEVCYFDSVRVNLGLFQHDVNVLWDLAPHDFSIMSFLVNKTPVAVSGVGARHVSYSEGRLETMAYVTVFFPDETIAHFHVNWFTPVKVRRTLIGGSKKMLVYDDLEPDEKVKVYDRGIEVGTIEEAYQTLVQYRTGDMYAPKLDGTEALAMVASHFFTCIQTGQRPDTDGGAGLKVVRLLQATQESVDQRGKVIEL